MSLYSNILKQALRISWGNKYLWFFGLFAALLSSGGEYEIVIRSFGGENGQELLNSIYNISQTGVFSAETISNIGVLFRADTFTMVVLVFVLLIILALSAFLIWLTIVSQAALVNNSAGIISNKKKDFKEGISAGTKNFWPVLGINIMVKLIISLAFAIVGLPLAFAAIQAGTYIYIFLLLFIIFVPIAISLSFMMKYAIAYVVIKEEAFFKAITSGWNLFITNWLVSIEMAFILFFINILFGLALMLVILVLAIPFVFLALLFFKLASALGFWLIFILAFVLILGIIVVSGAALATFQVSAWTGLFVELVGKGGISKLQRIFNVK